MANKKSTSRTGASRPVDLRSSIRLTIDFPGPVDPNAPRLTVAAALAQLTPIQRERATSASISGRGVRAIVLFPLSETRDLDEAIRALPAGLQAGVMTAEKLEA